MVREAYSTAVARHAAIMEACFDQVCGGLPSGELAAAMKVFNASLLEVERLTRLRVDATDYEYQRRQGKLLAELGTTVAKPGVRV